MIIDSNTTSEAVKEITKMTMQQLCSVSDYKEVKNLDKNTINRLLEIQRIIADERKNHMSIEEILRFLKSSMNYGSFQIWLLEQSKEITFSDKLINFLSLNSNEEILRLYDIEQNYDRKNIESINKSLKMINEE